MSAPTHAFNALRRNESRAFSSSILFLYPVLHSASYFRQPSQTARLLASSGSGNFPHLCEGIGCAGYTGRDCARRETVRPRANVARSVPASLARARLAHAHPHRVRADNRQKESSPRTLHSPYLNLPRIIPRRERQRAERHESPKRVALPRLWIGKPTAVRRPYVRAHGRGR